MKNLNERVVDALKMNLQFVKDKQNIFNLDFKSYLQIIKDMSIIFENEKMDTIRCSYLTTNFDYATDLYSTKPFHAKLNIDKDTNILYNVHKVEFMSLYPSIFAEAFSTGELDIEIKHFNKLFVWLVGNRGYVKSIDNEAYYVLKYIINAFYGILNSPKRIIRSTARYCLITKFFKNYAEPYVYKIGLIYWNVDEIIYYSESNSYVIEMLEKMYENYRYLSVDISQYNELNISDDARVKRFLKHY